MIKVMHEEAEMEHMPEPFKGCGYPRIGLEAQVLIKPVVNDSMILG